MSEMSVNKVKHISLDDCLPLMLEKISEGSSFEFTAHGTSMLPLIRDSEVRISPAPAKLKLLDMPLYRRVNGQFVLHRVVGINRDGSYRMCGDNQLSIETPISHAQVIGVVTEFDWDGKRTAVSDKEYIKYAKRRLKRLLFKRAYFAVRRFAGKILRKMRLRK
ncbi:MAG: S24/S26 family peptidase [Clostridia bacterium]|nr:S24/S26 family peptidase [Clostridia bacterium]